MTRKVFALGLCVVALTLPCLAIGGSQEAEDSAYWSALLHEENSLTASLLYFPYAFLRLPVGIFNGIRNPKPKTWATMPPQPHRAHPCWPPH